ncbi:hypothetical protein D1872_260010 [compost metagenome]
MTLPFLMTEMSTLVPPTSKKMPSEIFSYISAPATPAANPESIVNIGRFRTSSMLITPPSQRMIISCEEIFAFFTDFSVMLAVSIIFGMRLALTTAVRVRVRSPYSCEISCPPVANTPRRWAASTTRSSLAGSSTLYASEATMTSAPCESKSCKPCSTASSFRFLESRYVW